MEIFVKMLKFNGLLFCFLMLYTVNMSFASSPKSEVALKSEALNKFDETPLEREDYYRSFVRVDTELNLTYKSLLKLLNEDARTTLKITQREWIKWRDEKCDEVQEKIECNSPTCFGVTHDSCIIQMTADRSDELRQFKINTKDAVAKKFQFSRINKYVDHDYLK